MFYKNMEQLKTISIKEYLTKKGISFKEQGKELITKCLFSNCDKDSADGEAHLYFDIETSQYHCKKCGATGNIFTLAKYLGDNMKDIALNPLKPTKKSKKMKFDEGLVESCHNVLPEHIRQYLNARGIPDAIINEYRLGWGNFYGEDWITIPIKDIEGNFIFFKLRQDPARGNKKMTFPSGEAQIYGWETLQNNTDKIFICEGELDRLLLISKGVPAITGTAGAGTFKQEWADEIKKCKEIYVCYDSNDKDESGRKGAEKALKMLANPDSKTYFVALPEEVGEGGDITNYFIDLKGNVEDLFTKYAKEYPEKIDCSQFKPLTPKELIDVLGLTIKKDEENKLITFLCQLSAFTEDSQFNISFNAPSSTGKSYIPLESSNLFPEEDVMKLSICSPQAFFHEQGMYDKEKNCIVVDLSRKIIIFTDQPHTALLERLRALLSHDEKEIQSKITDKNQRGGNRTKTVIIKGFPSVIFCSAGLKIDEQEGTRFLLLSPEITQEKIRESIHEKIRKATDSESYKKWLDENPERNLLKRRILAIKQENIKDIKVNFSEELEKRFTSKSKILKPRHNRDVGRLISIIKSLALVNLWFRERNGSTITANESDIEEAFKIWGAIAKSQELNLSPYVYQFYEEVILPAWEEKNKLNLNNIREKGLTRQDINKKHYEVYERLIADWQLRQQILPMLETAGLIIQEPDPDDKRRMLIYPTTPLSIFTEKKI